MLVDFDVIVVGLGAAGAATLHRLAQDGVSVLGLEQFSIPNDRSSHHGDNRIIRMAYAENPSYVPMLRSAYDGWRTLEASADVQLLYQTGSLHGGRQGCAEFVGARASSKTHKVAHDVLSGDEVNKRFPGFSFPKDYAFVFQPQGGFVACEDAIEAFVGVAQRHGAHVKTGCAVTSIRPEAEAVRVMSAQGDFLARKVIVCAGPWITRLVPELSSHLRIRRQVVGWFETSGDGYLPDNFPVFLFEGEGGFMFGFPEFRRPGLKIGRHHHLEQLCDPATLTKDITAEDKAIMRLPVSRYMPSANGALLKASTCIYSNTPDFHFAIGPHPKSERVLICSACSGHGFKFAPTLGQIMRDLAVEGETQFDLSLHGLDRLLS